MAKRSSPISTRTILSSEAKAKLAQLVDGVYSHGTRYIIRRFDAPRAVLISLADYQRLLAADEAGTSMVREARPSYKLGEERTPEEIAALLGTPLLEQDDAGPDGDE